MATAAASIAAELAGNFVDHAPQVLPWAALYFGLHFVAEYAVPLVFPSVYDALGRKGGVTDRKALAKDARTRIVATVMALHVTVLSLYGLFLMPNARTLAVDMYASTPLTQHLAHVAVGYFIWDLFVVLADGLGAAYTFHGAACLVVFTGALNGWLHYMACVTLLFEASTPFMHARMVAIKAGASDKVVNALSLAFMAVFFLARIANGYYQCYHWWWAVEALLASGKAHNVPLLRLYQVLCLGLSGLNGYWFVLMLQAALCGRKGKGGAGKKGSKVQPSPTAAEDPSKTQ